MNVRYRVELSQAERDELRDARGGKHAARKLSGADFAAADRPPRRGDCPTVSVSLSTVSRPSAASWSNLERP